LKRLQKRDDEKGEPRNNNNSNIVEKESGQRRRYRAQVKRGKDTESSEEDPGKSKITERKGNIKSGGTQSKVVLSCDKLDRKIVS